jgi:hypothetical protein
MSFSMNSMRSAGMADPRTAHGVAVEDRWTVGSGPPVAPLGERDERGRKVATLLGQQIFG